MRKMVEWATKYPGEQIEATKVIAELAKSLDARPNIIFGDINTAEDDE